MKAINFPLVDDNFKLSWRENAKDQVHSLLTASILLKFENMQGAPSEGHRKKRREICDSDHFRACVSIFWRI